MASNSQSDSCIARIKKMEVDDIKSIGFWRAACAEMLASMFICYMVLSSEVHDPAVGRVHPTTNTALCAGFYVGVMVMTMDYVSGGHVNPAVSMGFMVQRKISFVRFLAYVIFHIIGGILGSGLLKLTTSDELWASIHPAAPAQYVTPEQALVKEFMLAFLLIFVIMAGTDKGRPDVRGSVPLMVGLTVAVGVFAGMPTSGGVINPVIPFGPAILRQNFTHSWVYWVGDMLGGGVAGILYNKVFSAKGSCAGCLQKKDDDFEDARLEDKPQWQTEKMQLVERDADTDKLTLDA